MPDFSKDPQSKKPLKTKKKLLSNSSNVEDSQINDKSSVTTKVQFDKQEYSSLFDEAIADNGFGLCSKLLAKEIIYILKSGCVDEFCKFIFDIKNKNYKKYLQAMTSEYFKGHLEPLFRTMLDTNEIQQIYRQNDPEKTRMLNDFISDYCKDDLDLTTVTLALSGRNMAKSYSMEPVVLKTMNELSKLVDFIVDNIDHYKNSGAKIQFYLVDLHRISGEIYFSKDGTPKVMIFDSLARVDRQHESLDQINEFHRIPGAKVYYPADSQVLQKSGKTCSHFSFEFLRELQTLKPEYLTEHTKDGGRQTYTDIYDYLARNSAAEQPTGSKNTIHRFTYPQRFLRTSQSKSMMEGSGDTKSSTVNKKGAQFSQALTASWDRLNRSVKNKDASGRLEFKKEKFFKYIFPLFTSNKSSKDIKEMNKGFSLDSYMTKAIKGFKHQNGPRYTT